MRYTVVYARRSKKEAQTSKEADADVHSLDSQIGWARDASECEGWRFLEPKLRRVKGRRVGRFVDDGYSGRRVKRPALEALCREVRKGTVERVLIHYVDRLARKTSISLAVLDYFVARDVKFRFGDMWETAGENGRLIITILSAIAEQQVAQIRRKTKEGVQRAIAEDKLVGRSPSGFTVTKTGKAYRLKKDGRQVKDGVEAGMSAELIAETYHLPITRVRRIIGNLEAWGGNDAALKRHVADRSAAARERAAKAEARYEEEEKEFRRWLISME